MFGHHIRACAGSEGNPLLPAHPTRASALPELGVVAFGDNCLPLTVSDRRRVPVTPGWRDGWPGPQWPVRTAVSIAGTSLDGASFCSHAGAPGTTQH